MHIELTTQAAPQEAAALSAAIVGFNHANVPGLEPIEAEVRFFVFARDDGGAVVGGIRAACYWNTLHIELLWLSQDLRGQGAGRALMARAEAFAREHACQLALVETTSWQARPFYEKCGYACIATIPDRPRGHTSYTLHKRLEVSAAESPEASQGAPGAGRFTSLR
jgi:GNAT superfamily N-acetyltransferase